MIAAARGDDGVMRCAWGNGSALYAEYHDGEWGRPVDDDRLLFEKLSLEGFQAGLAWITILRKRDAFREAFEPMPPLPDRIPPGLLVLVQRNDAPVPHANVFLSPLEAQNTSPIGVRADVKGTAWFWLKEPGRYRVEACSDDGAVARAEVAAAELPLDAPPGYDYLQRVVVRF